jgi:hypothetical protein
LCEICPSDTYVPAGRPDGLGGFFIDPLKLRPTAWAFDRYALPRIDWNLILNGCLSAEQT